MIGRSSIIGSYIQSAERLTSISDVQRSRKQEQLVKQYYKRYISHAVVLDGHGTPLSKQSGVVRLSRCVPESVESVVFSMAHSGAFSVSVTALERGILVHLFPTIKSGNPGTHFPHKRIENPSKTARFSADTSRPRSGYQKIKCHLSGLLQGAEDIHTPSTLFSGE